MSVNHETVEVLAPPLLLFQNYLCSLTANKVLFYNQNYQNAKTQAILFCDKIKEKITEKQLILYSIKILHILLFLKT